MIMDSIKYLRFYWFDLAIILAIALTIGLYINQPSGIDLILWLSLGSLFLHQIEEWRFPGYFPGMLNIVMFDSDMPDRYPLNASSGMIVNVFFGWGSYLMAALFWQQGIWLAIGTIMVSVGNIIAHTIIFNLKGRTLYNPGLLSSWLFFVPIVSLFLYTVLADQLATLTDWAIGLIFGMILNYICIYKVIIWLADRETTYVFPKRFVSSD